MKRLIIIKNEDLNSEIIMPVTPESFQVSHGINVETVNIHTLGDVAIAGYPTLATIKIDVLFPGQNYVFANFTKLQDPYNCYITGFQRYMDNRNRMRFVVSGTTINIPVKLENMDYSEKDGTNDVYATLTFHERKDLKAVQVQKQVHCANQSRSVSSGPVRSTMSYKIRSGDTLSSISKKYYGSASYYSALAKYNGIRNPNLIYPGRTLKLPPSGHLR